ncbi:MAG: hypothetical protein ABSG52_09700 [Terriglobales bacterium]|jgi:hypothetical protein
MTSRFRRFARLFSCLLMFGIAAYAAEPAKTVVSDTIYRADGSPASGTMMISWPAFVTGDGKPVAAGSKTVKIGADGAVNIPLVPTQGATPAGTYYKVVLSLDDGASSQEYWTVPTLSPTSIAAIRSSVVPATVAMQVVSREYVDGAVANTVRNTGDESIAGTKSFISSPLVPSPSAPTAAANKDYVDVSVAAGASGPGTLALNKGGTGQTSWTPARCVRVANNGSSLESAPGDCGIATNSDMVDGLHAASFQATMANAATLSKIAESGGNPLWNGSAWPGGGGSGNATQIQGKAVDTPDTARQLEVYDGTSAFKKWQDPVVRMNRDCGIVGSGDETAALNTCIANLPNYTGVLQCDKPGMIIHSTGVVVRDKVGIRIETAGGGHTLNNYCQLIYTGAAAGTIIDAERTRDSVLFKGFQIYAGAADVGFQTGQTGTGTNIATSDSFEEIQLNNNNGRATFVGFRIGDSTNQNSDEMKFNHVTVTSSGCTKCGIAFQQGAGNNVYGTQFRDIVLSNIGIGFDWGLPASIDRVNGSSIALLYRLGENGTSTFTVENEDLEQVDQILQFTSGNGTFIEEHGRVILNAPYMGGVTGTAGHPAWDNSSGGNIKIRNMVLGTPAGITGLTLLKGGSTLWADVDFYDPGITTYGAGIGGTSTNPLNFLNNNDFLSGMAGNNLTLWIGRGFIDEKGMMVPGVGMQASFANNLRQDFTPCTRGNVCFNEGQIELTGVHSIFNNPTIGYTGTAGSTSRYYAVVACSDTACAAGNRSIPSVSKGINNTAATLDGSDYVTMTWVPALGVNKYGILQQQVGSPNTWNLLMSNISCSTNPCTVNIATDSSTYASGYPSDNETGGVILRGAIKMGKSATQPAAVDLTYATVTPPASMISGLNADLVDGKHASDFLAAATQLPLTKTAASHKWLASYDSTTGTFTQTQPDYSDLSGTPTLATVAATGAYADLTGKPTLAANTTATSHQFFSAYNSTTGAFTKAQPDYSDLTGTPVPAASKTCTGTDKVSAYDASTGVFTCSGDQTGAGGSGITSLNGATVTTQTLVDGANIHVSTNTSTGAHTIAVTGLGDAAAKNTGTTAGTVAAGDDSRFTNARTPTAHASTHQNGGGDELATATAGANAIPKAGAGGTLAAGWIPDLSATYLPLHSTADLAAGLSAQYVDYTASTGGASIKNKPTLGTAAAKNVLGTGTNVATTSASAPASNKCVEFDTNGNLVVAGTNAACNSGGSMAWPAAAGIAVYGGSSAWGTSIAWNSGTNTITGNVSGNAGGTAAALAAQYVDWNAGSGGPSIANKPTLGTAAAKDIPASGDASATQVVYGTDTRLTNARAPSAHASTHQNGGDDEIATATAGANAIPKAGAGGQLAAGWMPAFTGDVTTSAGAVATTMRTGLNVRTCELHIWGTGTSSVLQDTDDEVASCLNKYGVTWTVTYVGCWANAGSPTVMITKSGGNNVLSGNLTCGSASWASGSLTGTTADKQTADGGTVDVNIVSAGGAATNIRVVIAGTI